MVSSESSKAWVIPRSGTRPGPGLLTEDGVPTEKFRLREWSRGANCLTNFRLALDRKITCPEASFPVQEEVQEENNKCRHWIDPQTWQRPPIQLWSPNLAFLSGPIPNTHTQCHCKQSETLSQQQSSLIIWPSLKITRSTTDSGFKEHEHPTL